MKAFSSAGVILQVLGVHPVLINNFDKSANCFQGLANITHLAQRIPIIIKPFFLGVKIQHHIPIAHGLGFTFFHGVTELID